MNKNNNFDNEKIIKNAAEQLGKSPEEIKKALENGNLKKAIGNLSESQAAQLNKALSNEEYAKKILSSPQAQALIKKLMKK